MRLCGAGVAASLAWILAGAPPAAAAYRAESLRAVSSPLTPPAPACRAPLPPRTGDASLATDPNNPRHLVAAWTQDRGGAVRDGAQGLGAAVSRNGGRSWSAVRVTGLTRCDGGSLDHTAVNEARVAIGRDGTVYVAGEIYLSGGSGAAGRPRVAYVVRSTDGGSSWKPPVILDPFNRFANQPVVTPDPARPRHAYAAWQRFEPGAGPLLATAVLRIAETDDAGASWSPGRDVRRPGSGRYDAAPHVMRQPNGSLVNVFAELSSPNLLGAAPSAFPIPIKAIRSGDGGATWSAPTEIGKIDAEAVLDPETRAVVNRFPAQSSVQAQDGTLYVAWRTGASVGSSRIEIARSRDGGRRWTRQAPAATPPARSFLPQVAVAGNGVVGVTYYDLREDRPGDRELTARAWFASSADRALSWQEEPLGGPFDVRATVVADESLIGDTSGLVGGKQGFAAALGLGPPLARRGVTSVLSTRIERCSVRFTARRCDAALKLTKVRLRPRAPRQGARARLTFRLSRRAGVAVVVERLRLARRRGRRCVPSPVQRRRCPRFIKRRRLALDGRLGRNSLRVNTRRFAPGSYRARVRAIDALGRRSSERRLRFRIR